MKTKLTLRIATVLLSLAAIISQTSTAVSQGTTFTYQGRLMDNGAPANTNYDLQFLVFDAANAGIQQGITLLRAGVGVTNGLFTTTLDFGTGIFDGNSRWLEIRVSPANQAAFVTLSPRQQLTPTPYAIYAAGAGTAATATSVPWLALTGVPAGLADGVDNDTLYSAGTGLNLSGTIFSLNTNFTDARYDARYWKLTGNAGTAPGVNFVGTTDNQALELKVNNARALRLEPHGTSPNVLGGFSGNFVATGSYGAAIGGGGALNSTNAIFASYATIAGGGANRIGAGSDSSAIGGGFNNSIGTNSDSSAIGGGFLNLVAANSFQAAIAGGFNNNIGTNSDYGAVGGGSQNGIAGNSPYATIAGGRINGIGAVSDYAVIGGGHSNSIAADAPSATIAGGEQNDVGARSFSSAIGGGHNNNIGTNSNSSTISGGYNNNVADKSVTATIAGGEDNDIGTNTYSGAIGGGWNNRIRANCDQATIAGGSANRIGTNSSWGAIGGGFYNWIADYSVSTTIAGGDGNSIGTSGYSAIGGGVANNIADLSPAATIAGGENNNIGTNSYSGVIGGGGYNIIAANSQYATIPGGNYAKASHYGQLAYAGGRFAATGDAQTSLYVLRGTTSGATQTEIFLDGESARMKVPNGASWTFEALIVARSSTGDTAGYRLTGVVENVGGALAGSFQAPQVLREDVPAWDVSATGDNLNDALVIQVTGTAATNIRWVASVRTVEVTY